MLRAEDFYNAVLLRLLRNIHKTKKLESYLTVIKTGYLWPKI